MAAQTPAHRSTPGKLRKSVRPAASRAVRLNSVKVKMSAPLEPAASFDPGGSPLLGCGEL